MSTRPALSITRISFDSLSMPKKNCSELRDESGSPLIEESGIWMPRVEAFSKFSKPIRHGAAIRVRLSPEIKGEKTIRYDFEIIDDQSSEAAGYVTVVCVDAIRFKVTPIPDAIRTIIQNA